MRERTTIVRVAAMAFFAMMGPATHSAFAQICPPITTVPGSESVEGFIAKSDNSCTVSSNTYVVTSNQYRIHTRATAYGTCVVQNYDQFFNCHTASTELHRVANINVRAIQGNSNLSLGTIQPVNASSQYQPRQEVDSRIANTTVPGGINWTPFLEGETTVRYVEGMFTTPCNFSAQKIEEIPVFVVACSPRFRQAPSGDLLRLVPGQTYVWIDPALAPNVRSAIQTAIGDWNLVQPLVQLAEIAQPCALSTHCIHVKPEDANHQVPSGTCLFADITPAQGSGDITFATIYFPSAASGRNANVLRRQFNHEMGHALGLDDYQSCASYKSLMAPTACNASSGFPLTPPLTDSIPVNRTVYGGAPSASCP